MKVTEAEIAADYQSGGTANGFQEKLKPFAGYFTLIISISEAN
jgi:hypothetical protein